MPESRTHTRTEPRQSTEPHVEDGWRVVVLNDPVNLMSYVVMVFKKVLGFDETNAEPIVRACTAFRLQLRERRLKTLGDEALETGDIDMDGLDEPVRKAFMCYLFLATVQELIIQHLDSTIIGS